MICYCLCCQLSELVRIGRVSVVSDLLMLGERCGVVGDRKRKGCIEIENAIEIRK